MANQGFYPEGIGPVTGGDALHYSLQCRFGWLQDFRRELAFKVADWRVIIRHLRDTRADISSSHFFEIGTGWYPTPFTPYLAGARRINLRHERPFQDDLLRAAVKELGCFRSVIAADRGTDPSGVQARYRCWQGQ